MRCGGAGHLLCTHGPAWAVYSCRTCGVAWGCDDPTAARLGGRRPCQRPPDPAGVPALRLLLQVRPGPRAVPPAGDLGQPGGRPAAPRARGARAPGRVLPPDEPRKVGHPGAAAGPRGVAHTPGAAVPGHQVHAGGPGGGVGGCACMPARAVHGHTSAGPNQFPQFRPAGGEQCLARWPATLGWDDRTHGTTQCLGGRAAHC